jgi:hypothetical protein
MKTFVRQFLQASLLAALLLGLFHSAPNFLAVAVYGSAIFSLVLLTGLLLVRYGSIVTINALKIDIAIASVSTFTAKLLTISLFLFLLQLVLRSIQ